MFASFYSLNFFSLILFFFSPRPNTTTAISRGAPRPPPKTGANVPRKPLPPLATSIDEASTPPVHDNSFLTVSAPDHQNAIDDDDEYM